MTSCVTGNLLFIYVFSYLIWASLLYVSLISIICKITCIGILSKTVFLYAQLFSRRRPHVTCFVSNLVIIMTEVREAGAFAKFRLLMWKNLLQQWRSPSSMFSDILLPLLPISVVLIIRSFIHPTQEDVFTYAPLDAYSLNYRETFLLL